MKIYVISTFPGLFESPLNESIIRRAQDAGKVEFHLLDLRDFSEDKHRKVDDYPYGGGPGMILKPEPFFNAFDCLKEKYKLKTRDVILMSPQGDPYNQNKAKQLVEKDELVFICGHYKGIDERVREKLVTEEISLGDYILTGGELAAMVVIDSVVRLIPGVIGDIDSARSDSFENGLLDCPYYTRPEKFRGMTVPDVLLSGHHAEIEKWRHRQSLERTKIRRQDLFHIYQTKKTENKE